MAGPIMRRIRAELNRRRVLMPMEIWLVLLARGFVRVDADPIGTQSRMAYCARPFQDVRSPPKSVRSPHDAVRHRYDDDLAALAPFSCSGEILSRALFLC